METPVVETLDPEKAQPAETNGKAAPQSFEIEFEDGEKKSVTTEELQRMMTADERAQNLEKTHKETLDKYSQQGRELAELKRKLDAGETPTKKEVKDFGLTDEDIDDPDRLKAKFGSLYQTVESLKSQLATLSDPKKQAEAIEAADFNREIEREVKSDPLLSKMTTRRADGLTAGRVMADAAVMWAVEENNRVGKEIYSTPREAIDAYKQHLGISQAANEKVERTMKNIKSILKAPAGTVSGGGGSGSGNLIDKWKGLSPKERIKFEETLSPEDSKVLGRELAKEDSG
jgi:hypothetical protein